MFDLWDIVVVPDGRRGRVVCLTGGRACVWHGIKKGETWWLVDQLDRPDPKQLELFA